MSKKKNDFWDTPEEDELQDAAGENSSAEEWSAVKSLPLKIIMRILLMISFIAAAVSGFVVYEYVYDRYADGNFNDDFFNSRSFAAEYDDSVDNLFQLLNAMEEDSTVTDPGNEERLATMIENYMGKDTNFSFMIQDADHQTIAESGDDAKQRIEASSHYLLLTSDSSGSSTSSTLPGMLLESDKWEQELKNASEDYIIYTAVDNELSQKDNFYEAQQQFNQTAQYFRYARIIGIIAVILLIISLIFSIMATGMKRGYDGVRLNWFDKIPTEIALIIMLAGDYGLYYLIRMFFGRNGSVNAFGLSQYLTYTNISYALMIVAYIWFIKCFFSVIRRIKVGTFYRKSIIGRIIIAVSNAIGKLPSALCVLLTIIILVLINGGVVYGCIFMRQYTVKGIPIAFLVAAVTFIYEIMAIVAHSHDRNMAEQALFHDDDDLAAEEAAMEEPAAEAASEAADAVTVSASGRQKPSMSGRYKSQSAAAPAEETKEAPQQSDDDKMDFESFDLGHAVEEAEKKKAESEAAKKETRTAKAEEALAAAKAADTEKTVVLSEDDIMKAINASAAPAVEQPKTKKPEQAQQETAQEQPEQAAAEKTVSAPAEQTASVPESSKAQKTSSENLQPAEDETEGFDLTQLTKSVRNTYRAQLKPRGIVASVRAPRKPVMVDMDQDKTALVISDIMDQMVRFSTDNVKNYAEVYTQGSKALLIVRVTVAEDKIEDAKKISSDGTFDRASKIVAEEGGRFISMVDDNVLKVGMLVKRIGA